MDRKALPRRRAPWLTAADEAHWVAQYGASGFRGPINLYRNVRRNFEVFADPERGLGGKMLQQPISFIAGSLDGIIGGDNWCGWMLPEGDWRGWEAAMREVAVNLMDCTLVEGAGHWLAVERPAEVNAALRRFLASAQVRAAVAREEAVAGARGARL